ncbi:MAG: hypothetical protein GY724_00310 [Actinomycetia bacterium]|nr:hypothetical protein [Actinomycetes bacterium]MCP3987490.1 hypothetical protein [Actinomycetes bacterium]
MANAERHWVRNLRSVEAAAVAGIVFGALFIAAVILIARQPPPGAPDREITAWLSDDSSATAMATASNLTTLAVIALLWFIGVFRRRVGDRVDHFTSTVFLGSGLVVAALLLVGATLLTAPTMLAGSNRPSLSPDTFAALQAVGRHTLLLHGEALIGVFMLSSSTMILRSAAFPVWLTLVSYIAAMGVIVNPLNQLGTLYLFPSWVVVVSVFVLLRRHQLPTLHPSEN